MAFAIAPIEDDEYCFEESTVLGLKYHGKYPVPSSSC